MVSRIALVAGETEGRAYPERQAGVDLYQAAEISLVPVIGPPGGVRDVFDIEALALGERNVLQRALPRLGDCRREYRVDAFLRDDEPRSVRLYPPGQVARPRDEVFELPERRLERVGTALGSHHVVEGPRFLVEAHLHAADELDASPSGGNMHP